MPVYHIVLFKLKPDADPSRVAEMRSVAESLVGIVPGLMRLDFDGPMSVSAHRAQGYDVGLVAILEKPEALPLYMEHPEHKRVGKLKQELCTDSLVYDFEYDS